MKIKFTLIIAALLVVSSLSFPERKGVAINRVKDNSGTRWAICIGIKDYLYNTIPDLEYTRNDAKKLEEILRNKGQFDRIFVMTDDLNRENKYYPIKRNVESLLEDLKNKIKPGDLVLFFFSGHGVSNPKKENFLLLSDTNPDKISETGFKLNKIVDWLKKMGVKKSLLLIDACRDIQETKAVNLKSLKAVQYARAEVAAVFYSTRYSFYSHEDHESKLGVFSKFVIEGLEGEADRGKNEGNGDGIVTFSELASFVDAGVFNWALDHSKNQRPSIKIYGDAFGELALSSYNVKDAGEGKLWVHWQKKFQETVDQLKKGDEDNTKTPTDKKNAWSDLLNQFLQDNPNSIEDEKLRKLVKERIEYWQKIKDETPPTPIELRSVSKNLNMAEVEEMMQQKGFYDKTLNRFGNFKNNYEFKIIKGHRVIIDHATGLMWPWGGSIGGGTQIDAQKWLQAQNSQGYAGYSDWRLPTLEEAASLLENSKMNGGLNIDPIFSNIQHWIWTSDSEDENSFWVVSFRDGKVLPYPAQYLCWARPVRSTSPK